ncbi:glycosyltransferase family 4 protein [Mucilaginibacter sp.]
MLYVFVNYNYSPEFTSPEGWIKRTSGYTELLEQLSENNTVISIKQINYEGIYTHNGVQHHFVNLNRKKTFFPYKINRYVRNLNPDIVFVQGLHQPLQLIQLKALVNKKAKFIAQHHAERPFTGLKKIIQRLADPLVDAYLFASKTMGLGWVNQGNLGSSHKIHEVMEVSSLFYPINKEVARSKTSINGDPAFLWVGRLNENKDPLTVVKAFLRFASVNTGARLYMIYQTEELLKQIRELLNASPHGDKIILVGKVPHDDLLYWFNSADFLLSGSHYEGGGTVVCEAMSCGCVPVVTDIDSFRMITDNGRCGLLYKVANEDALLNALVQTQASNIEKKQQNCLNYFKSNLSFDAIANRIQEIAIGL